jgi:predicted P-loop ATPase
MVPVAVGEQGALKSTAVATISPAPSYHGELDLGKDDDDLARDIRGKLIMEIGELKGINRKEIEHLKAFITRREDKWVQKYKEYQSTYARRCVFFATTNDEESLPPDPTGNRRWLPFDLIPGIICDIAGIARDRDQLWAEAREIYREHGVLWEEAERLAKPLLPKYTQEDAWVKRIQDWAFADELGDGPAPADGPLHINDVATGALAIPPKDISALVVKRIAGCLKKLGFRHTVRAGRKAWVFDAIIK